MILAVLGKFTTGIDSRGFYRVIYKDVDDRIYFLKFNELKTDAEVEAYFTEKKPEFMYGGFEKIDTGVDIPIDMLKEVISYIRTHPALTLTQFNTFIGTKTYSEQACIRYYLYVLTRKLAKRYGVVLDNFTESEILKKLRNWIVNTDLNLVKKLIFGTFINL